VNVPDLLAFLLPHGQNLPRLRVLANLQHDSQQQLNDDNIASIELHNNSQLIDGLIQFSFYKEWLEDVNGS